MTAYEPVIGLEVHAQLATETKMFCGCRARFGAEPNTQVCPVCLGLPGALPVVNARAIEFAVRMGLATHCTIASESIFARKNYFYPDCPKDYQISQFDTPLCRDGYLLVDGGRARVGITRIHLEEDAGKLIHPGGAVSYVDMNRSGVPLIEIVSEPDIRRACDAADYLRRLRSIVRYLGICDGNMEEGSLRCDVNVSVRPAGSEEFGIKTEIKNLNSFRQVEEAAEFEFERQSVLLEKGKRVAQDTLLWNAPAGRAEVMRSKEQAQDYRYFPEPDLRVLRVSEATLESVRAALPELPDARAARFVSQYGLPEYDAGVLTAAHELADYYETVASGTDPKAASNWVMGEVLRELGSRHIDIGSFEISAAMLVDLIEAQRAGTVNSSAAKKVFAAMIESGRGAAEVIADLGLEQISDSGQIEAEAQKILQDNPDEVAKYLGGKENLLQFFVGQLMRATRGKANPATAREMLVRLLDARR